MRLIQNTDDANRLKSTDVLISEARGVLSENEMRVWFFHDFAKAIIDRLELLNEKEQKTIDAAPVVHGEWINNTDDFTPAWRCSNCGYNKPMFAGEKVKQEPKLFCPNCGAKMTDEN